MLFYLLGSMADPIRIGAAAIVGYSCKTLRGAIIGTACAIVLIELLRVALMYNEGRSIGVLDVAAGAVASVILCSAAFGIATVLRKQRTERNG